MTNTDRIEKTVVLRATVSRVWRALTDPKEFGAWFRADLEGVFAVGHTVRGKITYPGAEHLALEMFVEQMVEERLFSFRWNPDDTEEGNASLADVQTTLVKFELEEVDDGTKLTVTESGFDQLPPELRKITFRRNTEGWIIQMGHIREHVET